MVVPLNPLPLSLILSSPNWSYICLLFESDNTSYASDICLNLLGRDWRPNMTAQQLAISILSMMSSAKEKKIPPDNAMHADSAPGQAQDHFMYHDDSC